ncbi:MAG: hypothetical protein Q9211_006518 [Gyalolechia sp. 1 TL-2023]
MSRAPLHNDLLALLPALRRETETRQYQEQLISLCATYRNLDRDFADQHEELQLLQEVIKSSSAFYSAILTSTCKTSASVSQNGQVLRHKILQTKHIQQVAKLGRYWDLCVFVTKTTRRYPDIFKNLRLELLQPYKPVKVPLPPTLQTVDCYVHAEIQLIVFYGRTPNLEGQVPRVLGVSKSACYLCDLFISLHGQYFISGTHGRLYDKWTVPNLASFNLAQRQKYRTILQRMHQICQSSIHKTSRGSRAYPPESTLNLHAAPSSLAASTVASLSQLTIRGPAPNTEPQDSLIKPNIAAADNITEGSRAPVQILPGSSPLPSINEIEEDHHLNQTESGECRTTLDGETSTANEDLTPSTPSSMSTINADTAELPLPGVVTHRQPYQVEIQGMRILFEIDTPRRGQVTVRRPPNELGNVVDIDAMTPGRTLDFYRGDGESSLRLDLRGRIRDSISIELEWLPD